MASTATTDMASTATIDMASTAPTDIPEESAGQHASANDTGLVAANDSDLVAESLLSFAKDFRYLSQCSHLFQQAIESIMPPNTARSEYYIQKTSWFMSSLLYILLVIMPSGRTLGMEVCGLKFKTTQQQVVRSLLATTVGWYALDYFISRKTSTDLTQDREDLRGNDRMEMHRRLRMRMLQRASSQQSSSDEPESAGITDQNATNVVNSQSLWERIVTLLRLSIKSITQALNQPEGPHSLENQQETSVSTISVLTWVLRLHLAHFCITGKYPTILHRLLRLDHATTDNGKTPIAFRPQTNRTVALLIGFQSSATFARFVLNWLAKRMAVYMESRQGSSSTRPSPSSLAQTVFNYHHQNNNRKKKVKSKSGSVCGICRLERDHPAAPISCGHVFCWSCLYQWISTVQKSCPLCRSACRAQDILPLYNYEQHHNTS